jgi:hypothetical protein
MAMLGLLELMASQNASADEMLLRPSMLMLLVSQQMLEVIYQ